MVRMTATEAARSFSELLTRVAEGEEIRVTRSGADVAVISPPKSRLMSAERFRELMATAPLRDKRFIDDVRVARRSIAPPEDAWQS
jgi:prevent-host-death family protein